MNIQPPEKPPPLPRHGSVPRSRRMVEKLRSLQLFRDYKEAFEQATGLPLMLRPLNAYGEAEERVEAANEFCALMAQTNQGCANCRAVQEELETKAQMAPGSMHCFAGLCNSAVPVRVGGDVVAFLQTGQILLHRPNRKDLTRTTRQLLAWGSEVNLKALEEAYFQTKVFDRGRYEAMLRLLATFAEHLAT
ncbi:MAG: PocR ligand-binding domain-containing protein, partial [Verrucomicrobiota bacterium]